MSTSIPGSCAPADAPARLEAARRALHLLLSSKQVRLERLDFEPDGALVVQGEAATVAAKKRTLRLAAAASDAPGIVDRLHVRSALPMGDGDIRSRLAEEFALDPRFKDLAIREDRDPRPLVDNYAAVAGASAGARGALDLEVRDGVVTLNGTVPSLVRKRLAGGVAWRIAGVRDVINGLSVDPPEDDGPDQLEEAARALLEGHPLFHDAQVKVGVRGDTVRLTGLVHSQTAREAAEEEIWRLLGVEEVVNDVEVGPGPATGSAAP